MSVVPFAPFLAKEPFHMPSSFVSHALLLKNLFDRRFRYTIPIYQRPYAWTEKESTRLLDDIIEAMGEAPGQPNVNNFFIGALILTGNMDETSDKPLSGKLISAFNAIITGGPNLPDNIKGNFDVVDGKQRLVTLKILLCLLRDLSANGDSSQFRDLIGDGQDGNLYRLELCGGEKKFLEKYVLLRNATLRPIENEDELSDGEKKLKAVRDTLHQNLLDLSNADRTRLLEYIVEQCEVVIILSEQIDHAFQIFLSINDTGTALTNGDILKAELMSKLSPEDVKKYQDIWEQWNDSLGEGVKKAGSQKKSFFNHFRHVLTSNPLSIIKDLRKVVDQAGGAENFIESYLIPNARAYEIINSEVWPNAENKKEVERILGSLNWLPHDDWLAPAMLAIHRFEDHPQQMLAFFRKLERLAYGLLVLPGGANDRKKKYNPLKRSLRDPEGGRDPFVEVELTPPEKEMIRKIIERGLHKKRPAAARLLLLHLDMMETGNPPSYYNELSKEEAFSVEHLLPSSPEQDSQWMIDFPDESLRLYNTELFGNLFLAREKTENLLMKNYDFPVKHAILFKDGRDHPIHLTNALKNRDSWRLNDIAVRQEKLLGLIDRLWS